MLMMQANDDTEQLDPIEQASTINHLMLSHTPAARAEVISALVAISPADEQYKQLRRLLGAMSMADQIKMSMSILQEPDQHRRIMLGIFDSARDEQEKATMLLDALHTMQVSKQTITLAHVLSAIRGDDLVATLRVLVGKMPSTGARPWRGALVALGAALRSDRWLVPSARRSRRAARRTEHVATACIDMCIDVDRVCRRPLLFVQ